MSYGGTRWESNVESPPILSSRFPDHLSKHYDLQMKYRATPVVSGHLTCTVRLSMSRHISTLNDLRSADNCLTRTSTVIYRLSVPAITDSANKCHVFGAHFNPKSLAARSLSCDRQFAQISCCHLVNASNISY